MDTYFMGDSILNDYPNDSTDQLSFPELEDPSSILPKHGNSDDSAPNLPSPQHMSSTLRVHSHKMHSSVSNKRTLPSIKHARFVHPPRPLVVNTTPELDVVEYEQCYRFFLDLPSIKKESIKISFQKKVLIIEGVRITRYEGSKNVLFRRRRSGSFYHKIPYNPDLMDVAHAVATYMDGELCITMNKIRN